MTDRARLLLTVLLSLWVLSYGYSVVVFATTAPTGDGFTRGLNRVSAFFAWQGIAGLIALPVVAVGRTWPKGSAVRRISHVPLIAALLLLAAVAALIVWARYLA